MTKMTWKRAIECMLDTYEYACNSGMNMEEYDEAATFLREHPRKRVKIISETKITLWRLRKRH